MATLKWLKRLPTLSTNKQGLAHGLIAKIERYRSFASRYLEDLGSSGAAPGISSRFWSYIPNNKFSRDGDHLIQSDRLEMGHNFVAC